MNIKEAQLIARRLQKYRTIEENLIHHGYIYIISDISPVDFNSEDSLNEFIANVRTALKDAVIDKMVYDIIPQGFKY